MPITIMGSLIVQPDGRRLVPIPVAEGPTAPTIPLDVTAELEKAGGSLSARPARVVPKTTGPADGIWAYDGLAIDVMGVGYMPPDEIVTRIKHAVLSYRRAYERMAREVDAGERIRESGNTARGPISEAVRLFVWQRDQGECVKCGRTDSLEFDHIIPLSVGGSSTERNIQLLCESCNRAKGASLH
jgi:hypothetical protein